MAVDKKIGSVIYFNQKKKLAIVKLAGALTSEKLIRFGKAGGHEQIVGEMKFAGAKIKEAKKSQEVGIKTKGKVKEKDVVFVIAELTVDREKREATEAKKK